MFHTDPVPALSTPGLAYSVHGQTIIDRLNYLIHGLPDADHARIDKVTFLRDHVNPEGKYFLREEDIDRIFFTDPDDSWGITAPPRNSAWVARAAKRRVVHATARRKRLAVSKAKKAASAEKRKSPAKRAPTVRPSKKK
jgi:hypothetical protein